MGGNNALGMVCVSKSSFKALKDITLISFTGFQGKTTLQYRGARRRRDGHSRSFPKLGSLGKKSDWGMGICALDWKLNGTPV